MQGGIYMIRKKKLQSMTKKERIMAAIHGEPVDQVPYSLWSHLPGIDLDPVANAEKTYDFYKTYDVDILKTMNNGMYSIEDFGAKVDYSDIAKGGVAKILDTPVKTPDDWGKVQPVSLHEGAMAREQRYLKLLLDKTKGEVPVVFTVFSPLTTANKLCPHMLEHIKAGEGAKVKQALKAITETTCGLVQRVIELGADGIFFATQLSSYDLTEESIYKEYGMPYDLAVLAASQGWCNVLHAHGKNIMFPLLRKYPVQIFNWHAWESLPDIRQAQVMTGKCIMAGLERMDITDHHKNEIEHQIYETLVQTEGKKVILSPGCVIRYPLDPDMLSFVRKAKEEIERQLGIAGKA